MKQFYVYALLIQETGELFYIGKTFHGSNRLNDHIKECHKGTTMKNRKLFSELQSGNNVLELILFESNDEKEIFEKEIEYISKYGRKDLGTGILCNHTNGGEGRDGSPLSVETKQKISNKLKGNCYVSRDVLSRAQKLAWQTTRKGYKHSIETRKRLSYIQRKPILMFDIYTQEETKFESLYHAVEKTQLSIHSIRDHLCGKIPIVKARYSFTYE
jgi:hypothetical protein